MNADSLWTWGDEISNICSDIKSLRRDLVSLWKETA